MQNSEFAYFSSKSGKCMKQMSCPPFGGEGRGVLAGKSGLRFGFGRSKFHFRAPENAKSAQVWRFILANPVGKGYKKGNMEVFSDNDPINWDRDCRRDHCYRISTSQKGSGLEI